MIKANELRIGNLVEYLIFDELDERKEWWNTDKINAVDLNTINNMGYEDHYRPIPLTEEWLVKFGFEKDKAHNCYVLYEHDTIDLDLQFSCTLKTVTIGGFVSADEMKNCKYVHQLQNLYFALTGEELELKPETT